MHSAYLDRITDNDQAVLLIDNLQKNFLIPISSLPSGSKPGIWFNVTIQGDQVSSIKFDEEKTAQMSSDIQNRLTRLQSKKNSRFKRRRS